MNTAELTNRLQNICHEGHAMKPVRINGHSAVAVIETASAVEITTDERRPETCVRHFVVPRSWAAADGRVPGPVSIKDMEDAVACHERYRCGECRFYEPREKKA